MKLDIGTSYRDKFTCSPLQGLQHLHALRMHCLRLLSFPSDSLHKVDNHGAGWEWGSLKPHSQSHFESACQIQGHMQAHDQFVGTELMTRYCSYGSLRFCKLNFCGMHGGYKQPLVAACQPLSNHRTEQGNLCVCSIHYRSYSIRSSQERTLIRIDRIPILSTHDEYRHPQRRYRADRLNPSWPVRLREFVVVSQYADVDNAKNYQKCDREVGVFHALAESCLKGILA